MYRFTTGIENLQLFGFHGYYEAEQSVGAPYRIDVYIDADVLEAAQQDKLSGMVDYQNVFVICQQVMRKPAKTLEYLALTIAEQIWQQHSHITAVTVRVAKLEVPVQGVQVEQTFAEVKKTC